MLNNRIERAKKRDERERLREERRRLADARGHRVHSWPREEFNTKRCDALTQTLTVVANLTLRHIEVINLCAKHYGATFEEVMGNTRRCTPARARQHAMFIMRKVMNYSYPRIADVFCRDHTTVMHAVDKIEGLLRSGKVPYISAIRSPTGDEDAATSPVTSDVGDPASGDIRRYQCDQSGDARV